MSASVRRTRPARSAQRKTLVAILSMHRSGSSVTTNVLQELGMSLGPFELMGAAPSNKYGHFEAMPLFELDREIHREAHGYADEELYYSPDLMQRIQRTRGRWAPRRMRKDWIARGRDFLDRLVASGDVSGFKDPRVPLIWNFWRPLLDERTGIRVVLLFLLRSPHEVAMSVFTRSGGEIPYERALIACEAHLRQMHRALTSWTGDSAIVRFGTNEYLADLKNAAELCGLPWSEEIAARVVDPRERHHRAAYVAHPAQRIYKRMGGESGSRSSDRNLRILQEDATEREALLRSRMQEARREAKRALIERTRLESQEARQVSPNETVARSRAARNAEAKGPSPETTKQSSEAGIHGRLDAMSEELAAIRNAIAEIGGAKPVRRRRRSPPGDSSA